MSAQLARRTGTVSALVLAAGLTMVAGVGPAAGVAAAESARREAPAQAGGGAAPGQAGREPVPAPVTEPVAAPITEPVTGPVAEPVLEAPVEPGIAPAPAAALDPLPGPAKTAPGKGPGRLQDTGRRNDPTTGAAPVEQPVQGPAADAGTQPAKNPASSGKAPEAVPGKAVGLETAPGAAAPAPFVGPVAAPAPQQPVAAAPQAAPAAAPAPPAGRSTVLGRRSPRVGPVVPVAEPRAAAPLPVAAAPRPQAPRVGPPVPVGPRRFAATALPDALAAVGNRAGRAQVTAVDAVPLRPTGAVPVAPARLPVPTPTALDLGSVLPSVAAGTVEAVARTPELPLGIAFMVVLFLLVQNRIDRRDPKVGLARVEDETLEFAPAGPVHLRVVTAAA